MTLKSPGRAIRFLAVLVMSCSPPLHADGLYVDSPPIVGDWKYTASVIGSTHVADTEGAATGAVAADPRSQIYYCGPGSMSPATPWDAPGYTLQTAYDMPIRQRRRYVFPLPAGYYDPPPIKCKSTIDNGGQVDRSRSVDCPNGTTYDATLKVCRRSLTPSVIDPTQNHTTCSVSTGGSNPINCATGEKLQTETDFVSPASPWMRFDRYYGSSSAFPGTLLGSHWRHSFSRRLVVAYRDANGVSVEVGLRAQRANGDQHVFMPNAGGGYDHDAAVSMSLARVLNGSGQTVGWRLTTDSNDAVEIYDAAGALTAIEDRMGTAVTLTYANDALVSVTDRQGRSLQFAYTVLGASSDNALRISKLTLPDGQEIRYGYDAQFNLNRVTWPDATPADPNDNPHRDYVYGEGTTNSALLTGIIDENGQRFASWRYDSSYRGTLSVHGASTDFTDRVEISYLANNVVSAKQFSSPSAFVTRTLGHTVVNGVAKLASMDQSCTTCGLSLKASTYDANGNRDYVTDYNGVLTDYDYNGRNLETQRIEAKSMSGNNNPAEKRTIQTDWHPGFRVPAERRTYNANGVLEAKVNWTYNSRGQVLTLTQTDPNPDPNSGHSPFRTTTYTYCEQANLTAGTCPLLGLVTAIDGPRTDVNDITTFSYYPSTDETGCAVAAGECHKVGDLWIVTNALGQVATTLRYDRAGRPTRTQDANGVVTDMTYWPRGWLQSRTICGATAAEDAVTAIDYDVAGLVTKVTQPDGSFTSYTYDSAHRLTDVIDNLGNRIHYTLDAGGRRIAEDTKDPAGTIRRTLSRVYDTLGQLQNVKNAAGTVTVSNVYDGNRNLKTATDAFGVITDNTYDPLSRLIQTLQDADLPVGSKPNAIKARTGYVYDSRDNLRQVTDPKNLNTVYTYDGLNNLTDLDSPDTGKTHYTYDDAGNRTSQTDARGVTSTYSYDALNRMKSVNYPTAALNVSYSYDQADGTTGCSGSFAAGRLTRMTDNSGSTTYCYDRRGNLIQKTQVTNGTTLVTQYAYSTANRLTSLTYPSGLVVVYARDTVGRISKVDYKPSGAGLFSPVVKSASYYPYGPASGLTFADDSMQTRAHDQNYWIDSVSSNNADGVTLDFAEDALGYITNVAATLGGAPAEVYNYDALHRLTTSKTGANVNVEGYTYDATGNRLTKTIGTSAAQTYAYSATSHRLSSIAGAVRSYDPYGNTLDRGDGATITYDDRNRMTKIVKDNETLASFNYSGLGERVVKGTTVYAYDDAGRLIEEKTGATVIDYLWMDNLPVGTVIDGAMYTIEADHLGTPRVLRDPVRSMAVWNLPFFGAPFGGNSPNEDVDNDQKKVVYNLRFPGQYYDIEDELRYNYFRDYEEGTGRYVESDPIGLDGGVSTFAYALENPLSFIDPSGLLCRNTVECACEKDPRVCAELPTPPQGQPPSSRPVPFIPPPTTKTTQDQCPNKETCDSDYYRSFMRCSDIAEWFPFLSADAAAKSYDRGARATSKRRADEDKGSCLNPGWHWTIRLEGAYVQRSIVSCYCCEDKNGTIPPVIDERFKVAYGN